MIYEGGKAISGASQIPKEMYEETVQGVLKKTGLDVLKYGTDIKPVGNTTKPFLGDIDLSIDFNKLKELWDLPEINDDEDADKTPENDFWEALAVKLKTIDPNTTVNRGLKQFHVPAPILNNGEQQPEFHNGKPVEGTKAIVQVDFFVGNVTWMTDMLSGTPEDSNFKAVFRNTLLGNIISKSYTKEYSSEDDEGFKKEKKFLLSKGKKIPNFDAGEKMLVGYVLDFKNGLEKKYTLIVPPSGRQRTPQEKRSYRFIERSKIDEMAEFIFGPGTKWSDLNSFEKVFSKFDSDPYFNKVHGGKKDLIMDETIEGLDSLQRVMFITQSAIKKSDEYKNILEKMRGRLQKDLETAQLQMQKIQAKDPKKLSDNEKDKLELLPNKIEIIQKTLQNKISENLNEAREGIGRFQGESQFTNKDFLEVIKKLVEETDNLGKSQFIIDFMESKSVDMVEKMDASFMQFGLDAKGTFFMEPNYGGPVTFDNVKAKFGFKKDSFDSFMALYENKKFQDALQQIFKFYGPFKFDAEMFPTFTHEGNKDGDVVFASTRYKKDKFGKFGGFVVFKTWLFEKGLGDWKRPEPAINTAIISKFKELSNSFTGDWKIYSNDADMRLPGKIKVDIGDLAEYFSDENKYQELLAALGTTKKSELRTKFLPLITSLRTQLQGALDNYANNVSSKLGDNKSKVEGVVLRIKAKNGDVFEVKGTSEDFAKNAKIVWEDRMKIKDIEAAFLESVLKNVLNAQIYSPETKTWDAEANSTKLIKAVSSISNILKPKEETIPSYLEALVPYITPSPAETVNNLPTKLKVEIYKAREELNQIKDKIKDKKELLDTDSFRKTKDFINSLDIILNDYEIILTGKSTNEQKYIALLEKYFGKKMEHAIVAKKPSDAGPEFEKRTKVILWSGRAQPWHKGHDQMVQLGKNKLTELGADKVFIVIIRGADSSTNVEENPLNKEEQENLINSVYEGDSKVELSDVFPPTPVPSILINQLIYQKGYIVVGWLCGEDRIESYKQFVDGYVPQAFKSNHDYAPIDFNPKTGKKAEIILTPRLMSGTKSRELTLKVSFEEWLKEVAPAKLSQSAKKEYEKVYNIVKERLEKNSGIKKVQEITISSLQETIKKRGDKFCLISKKSKRNLGCYSSRKGAQKREKQVQYFKHMKEQSAAGAGSLSGFSSKLDIEEEK